MFLCGIGTAENPFPCISLLCIIFFAGLHKQILSSFCDGRYTLGEPPPSDCSSGVTTICVTGHTQGLYWNSVVKFMCAPDGRRLDEGAAVRQNVFPPVPSPEPFHLENRTLFPQGFKVLDPVREGMRHLSTCTERVKKWVGAIFGSIIGFLHNWQFFGNFWNFHFLEPFWPRFPSSGTGGGVRTSSLPPAKGGPKPFPFCLRSSLHKDWPPPRLFHSPLPPRWVGGLRKQNFGTHSAGLCAEQVSFYQPWGGGGEREVLCAMGVAAQRSHPTKEVTHGGGGGAGGQVWAPVPAGKASLPLKLAIFGSFLLRLRPGCATAPTPIPDLPRGV